MQFYSLKDYGIAGKTKDAADTTPVNVVGSAYDVSGNGGRKIVRLSNNWIVAAVHDLTGSDFIRFYVSKDNGTTWSGLCYFDGAYSGTTSFCIVSNGTKIYCLFQQNGICILSFDAATQSYGAVALGKQIENQTAYSGVSLCIDGTGALHAAWSSKNATYPNSFNIRCSKSTDGGATWAAPTQITNANAIGTDYQAPCIVVRSNNNPSIVYQIVSSSSNVIQITNYNGVTWNVGVVVYQGTTYAQSNPCAAVDSNDVIHVVWHGKDATDATPFNIRYSKSTDGGVTWTAASKLTSGNSYTQVNPSITIDGTNLYVIFNGVDSAVNASFSNIRKITYNGAWSAVSTLTSNTTNSAGNPSTLWSKFTMNSDDAVRWIYQDNQVASVKYSSKPFTKVPDTTPSIIESYIPLWMVNGGNRNCNQPAIFVCNGSSTAIITDPNNSSTRLFTLSNTWGSNTKFALETTMWTSNSGNTATVTLWDMTANTGVGASAMSTTTTTATVFRSMQFTLTPGKVYGLQIKATNGSNYSHLTDASLVVFG